MDQNMKLKNIMQKEKIQMMLSQNHIVGLDQLYSIVTVYCCSTISIRAKKMMEERNLFAHYQGTMTKHNIWYIPVHTSFMYYSYT